MVDIQSAVIGAVAFLVLLFLGYLTVMRFTALGDDGEDTESTEDRLEMADAARHRRVGFRRRVSRQTPMVKAFLAAIAVLLGYLFVAIYQVASTGSPSEALYAEYLEAGAFGFVCVVGGVWFKAKQNAKAGELQIMLERDEGNKRKTVKFDRRKTRLTDDGTTLVAQLKSRPAFGLFWRRKLIADDPDRRDADHRLPDDLVFWEVPDDDSAVWNQRTGEVTIRAKGIREIDNPNRAVDYEIVPSDRKSKSEIQQLETDIRELESDLRAERVQNGILSENLSQIEDILTNEEDAGMRRIRKAKEVLEDDDEDEPQGHPEHHYQQQQNGRASANVSN